jgi:hypothetical protein
MSNMLHRAVGFTFPCQFILLVAKKTHGAKPSGIAPPSSLTTIFSFVSLGYGLVVWRLLAIIGSQQALVLQTNINFGADVGNRTKVSLVEYAIICRGIVVLPGKCVIRIFFECRKRRILANDKFYYICQRRMI